MRGGCGALGKKGKRMSQFFVHCLFGRRSSLDFPEVRESSLLLRSISEEESILVGGDI